MATRLSEQKTRAEGGGFDGKAVPLQRFTDKHGLTVRRTNSEHIDTILQRFLREEGLETPLNQHRLLNAWGEVMGQGILRYTGETFIKNQTLHVQIRSSVLRNELSLNRKHLVERLNQAVGAQVITDISFH